VLGEVSDERVGPRFRTSVVLKAGLGMFWGRLGSLNALEGVSSCRSWKKWLGSRMPSADTVGRVFALMDTGDLRKGLHHVYTRLKRNKALSKDSAAAAAVLDGHETHASYRRHCVQCLQRTIHTQEGDRIQYYHRNVTLMLVSRKLRILLDVEPQRKGEDEVATALRLLERVLKTYPRAFQVILADALYTEAPFINFLWAHHKYCLLVLKDERRDIYQDALALFQLQPGQIGQYRNRSCLWSDVADLTSWPQVEAPLRVVRSQETYSVRRQATRELVQERTEWLWLTNLPASLAPVELVVHLGHSRWDIENYGFNELVNGWYADHVYRHHPTAIEALYLTVFLAFNLFHAFLALNLKPAVRQGKADSFWIRTLMSEIYGQTSEYAQIRAP
jgi:hypothetical protein